MKLIVMFILQCGMYSKVLKTELKGVHLDSNRINFIMVTTFFFCKSLLLSGVGNHSGYLAL